MAANYPMIEQKSINTKISVVILSSSLFTLVLYVVPFLKPIAYPFLLLSTLVHEMGHGVGAILVGGRFESFQMFADGSGVAELKGDFGRFSQAFVASLGLLGPALISALFFSFLRSLKKCRALLGICGLILSLSLILVVRSLFAFVIVALIIFLCFFFSLGKGKDFAQSALGFLAMQLSLSVFSRSDYLFTKTAQTSMGSMPSDVEQIAEALFFPYWFWGICLAIISVTVLFYGVKTLIKG